MIVVYAGRRSQSLEGDLEAAALRIRRLLNSLAPAALVGALADGGDLLVAEAALGLGSRPRLDAILPTPEAVFRDASVTTDWQARFDRAREEILARDNASLDDLGLEDGTEAYRRANRAFFDHAAKLATPGERVVALVVAHEGEGELVEDLTEIAKQQNAPVLRIDPSVEIAQRPRVFVAMPYGRKRDPQRMIDVDCDLVYSKILVPALEHAQLRFMRADKETDSGVILQPMIEWLADADLVIGDLQTANFNVGWELGLRHLLRCRNTLLVRPRGTSAPFDLNAVRQVQYSSDEKGVSDDAAAEAWEALAPYLQAVDDTSGRCDSPVAAAMEVEQWGRVRLREEPDEHWERLRDQLAAARDAAAVTLILEVLAEAHGVAPERLRALEREAGIALAQLGCHREAREPLRAVVEHDRDVRYADAHLYYAQALYRPKDASLDDYAAAESVLTRVLVKRPAQPEVRALLGALAKRRLLLREDPGERETDLRFALEMYRQDFERDLNAYYEGINVIALATVLELVYGDEPEATQARELVPAVALAAKLAARAEPRDYWPLATVAECTLYESLLGLGDRPVADAYAAAGALRPMTPAFVDSSRYQLDFLEALGVTDVLLGRAREALLAAAGAENLA